MALDFWESALQNECNKFPIQVLRQNSSTTKIRLNQKKPYKLLIFMV